MPFPLGGDFSRSVDSLFKIVKTDRRICIQDNGTNICDLGFKLKFPGTCFNQPIGTFNSTDPTFQPTFPICLVDYESSGFNDGLVFTTGEKDSDTFVASAGQISGDHIQVQIAKTVDRVHDIFKFSVSETGDTIITKVAAQILSSYKVEAVPGGVSSFWKMVQLNPGVIPHLPGFTSELFTLDVFSFFTVYKRLTLYMIEQLAARILSTDDITSFKNLVSTNFFTTISGQADICVDDERPPFITLFEPTESGIHLRPRDQIVDFSLTDAVGGVDLSSVFISVDSTSSGTISLVEAGADQTGGEVSIVGDPSSFRFTWVPSFSWDFNDQVLVSISGADLPPQVGGSPFFCGLAEVNHFIGDIPFQVFNFDDMPATISGMGDVTAPILSFTSPAPATTDNNVFSPVTVSISDDLTGVDLGSIIISVGGKTIVNGGIPSTPETVITGTPDEFTITYSPDTAFSYDTTVGVSVFAQDKSELGPNVLSDSYSFSFIEEGTLIIEDFLPAIGTTRNVHTLDIEVDVRDDSFDVDLDQTFFVINGTIISGSKTPIVSGTHMTHHPPNDFNFGEPIRVTVHATNDNTLAPVVKEAFFTLFYGCRVTYFNEEPYEFGQDVNVFVRAQNTELLHKDLSTGYFFTARTQPSEDLGAEIFAVNKTKNLGATLNVIAPEHRYGETVTVEFFVKDFDGHELGPITYSYTIEDRPE